MPYLPIHGTRLYYQESGPSDGRPLLLLHASLQSGDSTEPLRRLLGPLGFRMIYPDQRGHGRTANPGRILSMSMLADDIEALLDHLGVEKPILIGYSLGAMVGLELAIRGRLSAIVDMAGRIHQATAERLAFKPEHIRATQPVWAASLTEKHVEQAWEELADQISSMLATWPGFRRSDLAALKIPLLAVQGDRDLMVPVEQAEELADIVPGGKFVLVPRAGHPELLYRKDAQHAVLEFIQSLL